METTIEIINRILAIIPETETELRGLLENNRVHAEQSPETMKMEWLNTIYENLHISIFRHWNTFESETQRTEFLQNHNLVWQDELWHLCQEVGITYTT